MAHPTAAWTQRAAFLVAVLAVIGYRLVNFWLPLPIGAAAYVHLRATAEVRFRRSEAG